MFKSNKILKTIMTSLLFLGLGHGVAKAQSTAYFYESKEKHIFNATGFNFYVDDTIKDTSCGIEKFTYPKFNINVITCVSDINKNNQITMVDIGGDLFLGENKIIKKSIPFTMDIDCSPSENEKYVHLHLEAPRK